MGRRLRALLLYQIGIRKRTRARGRAGREEEKRGAVKMTIIGPRDVVSSHSFRIDRSDHRADEV